MGELIRLAAWVERKVLGRGRVPLMDTHQPHMDGDNLQSRLARIKESLAKIDDLMKELKGGSDVKS